jgi:tetratricopeptide (TPR) repeat protein
MLTFVLSFVIGAAVAAVFKLGNLVHSQWGILLPGFFATLIALVLLMRRAGKKVMPLVEEAQRHMQGGRKEMALKSLRAGLAYKNWQPMLEGQLRTQIGAILYASGDLDGAITELEHASKRPWEAPAFLGCAHFRKKNPDEPMVKAFEKAVKVGEKDSLSWTVYAWCMNARGKKDEAVAILQRGLVKNPKDQRIEGNIELLQGGKKMKVAPYGDRWAAFGLDGSVPGAPKGMKGMAQRPGFRPGFRQRPVRR